MWLFHFWWIDTDWYTIYTSISSLGTRVPPQSNPPCYSKWEGDTDHRKCQMSMLQTLPTLVHAPSQQLTASMMILWLIIVSPSLPPHPRTTALGIKCTLSPLPAYLTSISNLTCPREGVYITCLNPLTPHLGFTQASTSIERKKRLLSKTKKCASNPELLPISAYLIYSQDSTALPLHLF